MTDAKIFQAIQRLVAECGTSEMSDLLGRLLLNGLSFNPDDEEDEEAPVDERIDCPGCGNSLAYNEAWRGTESACKYCGHN